MEKLQQLWNAILDLTAKLVIPDWGALVGLIPIALLAAVVLWIAWLVWAYTHVGPRRRGFDRALTVPPPGIHAPGPSFAPFFGAVGTALVLFGLVVGPVGALLGVAALVLALLYWLREGMREYEHVAGSGTMAVTVLHGGPPPGVHVPGPTFLPFTSAVGFASLLAGLVVGGWMILAGFICLVIALVGWWRAARTEYRLTEEADRTGHMRNPPAPGFPLRTYALFTIIIARNGSRGFGGSVRGGAGLFASGQAGRRRHDRRPGLRVHHHGRDRPGRQALRHRLREPGSGHAPQRRDQEG